MKQQFAILGLGRFGGSLCRELSNLNVEVLAIDNDIEKVNEYTKIATHAVQANTTDETVLIQLGIRNFDQVFVSFGENIQASVLTTMSLKELGVRTVWAKAQNDYHHKILKKIGADHVIHPERDIAKRLAHHIVSEKITDYIELSKDHSIVEVVATKKIADKSLIDLNIPSKYGCIVIALKRGEDINIAPTAGEIVHKGDILMIIGANKDIHRFEQEGV